MPIQIVENDITKIKCDAIVNAANSSLLGGGGVDGAIHRAAGPELLAECRTLGGCPTGEARVTKAYNLPAKYVIHTVGPVWHGGDRNEEELLKSCYRESMKIALEKKCATVAFPLISAGVYGYPKDRAMSVAVDTITAFLSEHDMLVYMVVFDKSSFRISRKLFSDIAEFIEDRCADAHFIPGRIQGDIADRGLNEPEMLCVSTRSASLEDAVEQLDESFTQMVLRKIDEKGMTDVQCYRKANLDRKLFSKIRSNTHYRPSKTTALALAIALELSLEETKDMLMKAGFALSHSNKFDIIIEYFINKGNYNINEINQALFAFDQSLLGC